MAVGKVARLQAFNGAQAQIVENLCRTIAEARLIGSGLRTSEIDAEAGSPAEQLVGDNDVLQRRHFFEDRRLLKCPHDASSRDFMGWQAGDRLSVVEHFAGGRRHEGTNQLEQRAFACAIRPDNGDYLSFFNREAHVVDSSQATITFGYSLNLEDRHG